MGDFGSFVRVASIGAFVLLTTPVAGHVIARASYFADVPLWKGTVLDERRQVADAVARTDEPDDASGRGAPL
jgi:multicomponent Na+:H+ antiporter subunit G